MRDLHPHVKTARSFFWQHYSLIQREFWPFSYFDPVEIACKGDGTLLQDLAALVKLEKLRQDWQRPIVIHSGYRSPVYNAHVGGAEFSFHLQGRAFDCAIAPGERDSFIALARQTGFTGIGVYETFVHVDDGPVRRWGLET